MTRNAFGRAAVLVAALCLLLGACSTAVPAPLVGREVVPTQPIDPARPCAREASTGNPAAPPAASDPRASIDRSANKIVLSAGENVSLAALSQAVNDRTALRELAPGEWLLGANLEILAGASLQMAAPSARWLKLSSGPRGFVSVKALGGRLDVSGTCVTSWDQDRGSVDTEYGDGRSFLLARDGGQMTIDRAEIRFLGHGERESYGLSWRTEGSGGGITNSVVSHLYFGLYSFEVGGLLVLDNEFHDNVLYGIDPHTSSHDLRIERNIVHDNGKHGIILAEDCVGSVIRENVVYNNGHHGIVLYLNSDRNLIENNESFGNVAQGININESSQNVVRANRVYDNGESGVAVGQRSQDNLLERNDIRANQQDGIRLVSEALQTDVRDNVIGENVRYGVYVDSDGAFSLGGNTIFSSRVGILLKGTAKMPTGGNELQDNRDGDIKNG